MLILIFDRDQTFGDLPNLCFYCIFCIAPPIPLIVRAPLLTKFDSIPPVSFRYEVAWIMSEICANFLIMQRQGGTLLNFPGAGAGRGSVFSNSLNDPRNQ